MLKFVAVLALGLLAAACQPVDEGAGGAHIFADCEMHEGGTSSTGAGAAHSMNACVSIFTSGATTSTPTTTTTPTVTVPVSALPSLP